MTRAVRGLANLEYTQYCCSKAALNMMALNYLERLKDENITVVVTTPDFCATQLNNHAGTRSPGRWSHGDCCRGDRGNEWDFH